MESWLSDFWSHLHTAEGLSQTIQAGGISLMCLIIFAETGLLAGFFLPGDSLLVTAGVLTIANGDRPAYFDPWMVTGALTVAAIIGDTVNYWIGNKFGSWMLRTFPRIVKPSHIEKTNEFYQRYGGKTIIIARFVPIVRTFAPFVAGTGNMDYKRFMFFNVIGAILWVVTILPAGWFFGNIPIVKKNFELVVLGIIAFSLLPMVIEILRAKYKRPEK